jgi:hypothetical protein
LKNYLPFFDACKGIGISVVSLLKMLKNEMRNATLSQ